MSQSTVDDGKSQQPSTNPSYASSGVGTASFVSTTSENEKLPTIIYVKMVAAIVTLLGGAILAITINLWMPVRSYPGGNAEELNKSIHRHFGHKPIPTPHNKSRAPIPKYTTWIPVYAGNTTPVPPPSISWLRQNSMVGVPNGRPADVIRGILRSSTGQCLFGFNGDGKGQVGALDCKSKHDFPLVEYSGYAELKLVLHGTDYCLNFDNQSELFTPLCNQSQHHVSERFLYLNNKSFYSIENGKCLGINSKLNRQGNRIKYHTIGLDYCSKIASQIWNFV